MQLKKLKVTRQECKCEQVFSACSHAHAIKKRKVELGTGKKNLSAATNKQQT